MIELRKPSLDTAEKEWKLIKDIPEEENGLTNEWYGVSYEDYINKTIPGWADHEKGINLKPGFVPDSHYFLWVDDEPVGIYSLRHVLNDFLRNGPGHIGYGIAKRFRGKGYATEGLRLLIEKARELPIDTDEIYLSVHKTNPASLRVQQKNGAYIVGENDKEYLTRIKL
ncbi:GNAT family N-acetyltransferase [Candidatus Saccharibacteria bacterium]|nr:GNAT family N-acetyltransferase [Candidatus Saccharibacteria bacterium]